MDYNMMEKLIMLCADSEFAKELNHAVDNLKKRKGDNPDINELKLIINKTIELCQQTL